MQTWHCYRLRSRDDAVADDGDGPRIHLYPSNLWLPWHFDVGVLATYQSGGSDNNDMLGHRLRSTASTATIRPRYAVIPAVDDSSNGPGPVPLPVQAKDAIASRKRRRRAPAGGASDDCFTCIRRNVKCDRRRPYCSQCLEVSNECSGYKTQLTWGVGVASRGKLRGLSLPVAKSPPAVRESGKRPSPRARAKSDSSTLSSPSNLSAQVQSRRADRKSAAEPQIQVQIPIPSTQPHVRSHIQHSHQAHAQHADHSHLYGHAHTSTHQSLHWPDGDDLSSVPSTAASRSPIDIPVSSDASAASAPVTPYGAAVPSYDYLSMTHHNGGGSWSSVAYSPDHDARFSDKFPLSLITDGLSSVSSVSSELDYISPMSHSYPREDVSFVNSTSPGLMYDSYSAHHDSPVPQTPPSAIVPMDHHHHHHHHRTRPAPPTSCPSLAYPPSAPSASGHHHHAAADLSAHHLGIFESQMGHQKMMMRDCSTALGEHHLLPSLAYTF
ncbi:Pfam:DUF3468 [Geosmithia morbida]|uniref:Pfam:DUF3468 n=1 Tax=Geosmithia morbida TaxID=1094350 RepID=A0A9P5D1V3_9HYPO|nr:Pfam:DUF3468 [Geosmithia morbida]KAF4120856.1 Pfam:DUF3468 [Geosmithia morbida]